MEVERERKNRGKERKNKTDDVKEAREERVG